MYTVYDIAVHTALVFLRIAAFFKPKIRLFVRGRAGILKRLEQSIGTGEKVIWMHAASLGEYEQGLPVLQDLRNAYPGHKILLTFFSPSGFEVKRESSEADWVFYLPLDTGANARMFLSVVRPELAIFVKYEIWPNYLRALRLKGIPALLISARFKREQIYFKWYGKFMRKALGMFTHIFVQDEESRELLMRADIHAVSVSGDTRFDRVTAIRRRNNELERLSAFKNGHCCLVAGSTWPEDEALLIPYINGVKAGMKCILVPHDIDPAHISGLAAAITKPCMRFSEIRDHPANTEVIIVDTIGLLTKIYSYADVAYVGGGFATGLHNTLEPAVFGIPVITGPGFKGFREAEEMVNRQGIFVISDFDGLKIILDRLREDRQFRKNSGERNEAYIREKTGASRKVMAFIRTLLRKA